MATQRVDFQYRTGLKRPIFTEPILRGSWDASSRYSDTWTDRPMDVVTGDDGCQMFTATVELDTGDSGRLFKWGVSLSTPHRAHFWAIPSELNDPASVDRYLTFHLDPAGSQVDRYYFTHLRRLGANKHIPADGGPTTLRFAVWAPNAQSVEVVFGDPQTGYIANDGTGIVGAPVPLTRNPGGIWEGSPTGVYGQYLNEPYMYRITDTGGTIGYRTDIFSRSQIGRGSTNPGDGPWARSPEDLDGSVSCSVVIDPDLVRPTFQSGRGRAIPQLDPAEDFWATEFTAGHPVPQSLSDLVIYELHIGSLGFDHDGPGTLADALALLDHVSSLGVNAVELLPMAEFSGDVAWGYGDTHHLCIESSAGGRDKYRHFVRECHRRGIAVIQDVVYNHYDLEAGRAEWEYDSAVPEQNIYYWYEGRTTDYAKPDGGYLDNGSSGWAPRYWEPNVRQQFISSAAFLVEEMHVDGLRVDLTQALHRDNALHANGSQVSSANMFGQKLLREWSRTLKMIRPNVFLVAEDHTGWPLVTFPAAQGGLGFDITWAASFYHGLIGDANVGDDNARLLKHAGFGYDGPIPMDSFAGQLYDSYRKHVVYHESHDEAGNAEGTARTINVAVNGAPLIGGTRVAAEARTRVAAGLSLLSAGTPMFLMGEEVGAAKPYRHNDFLPNREDITGLRVGYGANLFRYYQDLITLRQRLRSLRSANIDILHQSNDNRLIAFKRWEAGEQAIVIASLNNIGFPNGYVITRDEVAIPTSTWREVFNSDAAAYGGANVGNLGAAIPSAGGRLNVVVPANGLVVLDKSA